MERFFANVNTTDTCWLWTGRKNSNGYGFFSVKSLWVTAHKWYYEQLNGPVKSDSELDHLCRVRNCVNPAHLEPVTRKENCRRGQVGKITGAKNKAKTHCPRGHEYNAKNTYVRNNGRRCNVCHKERERIRRLTKKQGDTYGF